MDVLVIGAGVSGLTTGICLAEAGLAVTIRAAVPPERTTSAAAGAVWGAVRVGPPERVLDWGRTGLEVLSKLATEPGTGVRMVSGKEVSRTPLEPYYWTALLPGLRLCEQSELPGGFAYGWHYTAPVATMPVYLDYLRARFERAGGALQTAAVASLTELAGVAPVVVNCSGVGARDLVPDPAVMPVRGQVVIAANPGIEEFYINRDEEPPWIVYMFPHGDTILLGGTNEEGAWDEDPKPYIAERIVAQCAAIDPRLRGAAIRGHRVGLRPYRPEVRLESEPLSAAPPGRAVAQLWARRRRRLPVLGLRRRDRRRDPRHAGEKPRRTIASTAVLLILVRAHAGIWRWIPRLLLFGAGVGTMLTSSGNVVQSSFPDQDQGEISGLSRQRLQPGILARHRRAERRTTGVGTGPRDGRPPTGSRRRSCPGRTTWARRG